MHPAPSVIVFSTLSGMGYGLVVVIGLGLLGSDLAALAALVLATVLISIGLLSSTAHLGHPERFLLALTQWRSSWLSREGVLAILTYPFLGIMGLDLLFEAIELPFVGWIAAVLSAATVVTTSMIYTQLRTVAVWHTPLTPLAFLTFAGAGGLVAGTAADALFVSGRAELALPSAIAIVAAWIVKLVWWARAGNASSGSTVATATGLDADSRLELLERPHINENYLTREMVFRVARKHALRLRQIALVAGGLGPVGLLWLTAQTGMPVVAAVLGIGAVLVFLAGTLVERWLFFAEARHTVSLYYGAKAA